MAAIEVDGVTKRFGDVTALDDVSLSVEEGEVFGFLGPNGAGKSTTINVLLDFVRPTAGSASVLGYDAQEDPEVIRRRTGVLPEGYDVYERLTGRQHLQFVREAKEATTDVEETCERVGLDVADLDRKTGGYSKGMKQRLVLGMALVGEPDLLILDEPSTGLDPNGARTMREIVREERDRGATVFFSSHILGQVEAVCDTVGILQDGRFIAKDTIDGLRAATDAGITLRVVLEDPAADVETVRETVASLDGPAVEDASGNEVAITCQGDRKMGVLDALRDAGVAVADFETEEQSLEELFAAYTDSEP